MRPFPPSPPVSRSASRAVAVATLVCVLVLLVPATALGGTMFNLVGRGFGHGIGLSAWGAFGYAEKTDLTYKQILKHYYQGIGFGKTSNVSIRVLLNRGLSRVEVSSDAQFTIAGSKKSLTIPRYTVATIRWDADTKTYRIAWGDKHENLGSAPSCEAGDEPLKMQQPNMNAGSGGMHYRNKLWVRHYSDGLMVVNKLALELYLRGVLPCEVPASWPRTALRVFAVACRTYAVRSRRAGPFDVYCTTASQVYNGYDRERAPTNQAIDDTSGEIATYGGRPILACFSSTSGGHTESIQYGWPGASPVPYLRGVSDPYERQDPTYAHGSPYHIWPENPIRLSASSVESKVGGIPGSLRTIYVVKRGVSPRVVYAYVVGSAGSRRIDGLQLRAQLALRSSWVYITTMSIARSRARVPSGGSVRMSGRIYPARPAGATVKLHIQSGGVTRTRDVRTYRHSQSLPNGSAARYSAYSCRLQPGVTTTYWYSSGSSISPKMSVTVY